MPRRPAPWYKTSHKAWYAKIDGKLHRLGENESDAWTEFYRIMADGTRNQPPTPVDKVRVFELVDRWLNHRSKQKLSARTREIDASYAENFVSWLPKRAKAADIRPSTVDDWIADRPKWGKSTQVIAREKVKAAWRWAKSEGLLSSNPLESLRVGQGEVRAPADVESISIILNAVSDQAKEILGFMLSTGARPGEAANVEAKDVNFKAGTVDVVGKMGARMVVVPSDCLTELRRLARLRPTGKLFPNDKGGVWTDGALHAQILRAKRRTGATGHFVPYHCRGIFASRLIAAGVDSSVVGKMLGHSTPYMLHRHYHSPELETLRDAIDKPSRNNKKPRRKPG